MESQVLLSSSRPPSTACSASSEFGGTRNAAASSLTYGRGFRRNLPPEPAPLPLSSWSIVDGCSPRTRGGSVFGGDHDRQVDLDVGVQVQLHVVLADQADRAARQAHFSALDGDAALRQRFGDVGRADRAEQLAFRAGLRLQVELE